MTPPTGPAAGVHLPWAEVPGAVQTWAAGVGGGSPRAVHDKAGGFSPGATAVLDCPGSAIFVKAVGAALNPDSPEMHRREAVVSAALPAAPQLPQLLDVYDDGDWVALAFVAVDGRPPAHPWDPGELRAAADALRTLHETLTPNPVAGAEPATDRLRAPLRRLGRAGRPGPAPGRPRRVDRPQSGPPGRARVGVAGRGGGIDAAPLRRALRQLLADGERRRAG